ncbi:MAG: pteridine reductase [Gammaproteobacteria bacterium (ex Lamellibrachia satsuma)]|nr:MAG: pteridine reductase [Gammaproteobacteria bacterium (ex Lamellibrachia satsuma)]RRS35648.1 MAG: pteridine reductase [Gammaproteobacteria bacterium (ex Lamellibrachia satsuma)]RRS36256.1 MAG: pteridine reductase [Gammaproteobacteria bacterium (ex Lamellibrachia satsuma)]
MTPPLSGRCALITGGAHRIGAQIARSLHREGMNLVLHYRNSSQAAERLKAELETGRPGSVVLAQADLHETADLPLLIEAAKRVFGRLDLLVNNASSFYPTPLETATETDWDDLIGSNLKAPFFLSRAAAPLLKVSDGCIVNLVDIHAERPLKAHPIYSVAKAGNAMLVKSLARELGPEIRVNGIAPGAILWPERGLDAAEKEEILNRTALKRPGSPEDIAQTLLFLVRDAHYITGQIIPVDGGRTLQQ